VYVQLLEARDVGAKGEGMWWYCCASLLHLGGSVERDVTAATDVETHYLIDHNVGGVASGHVSSHCRIDPQQKSKRTEASAAQGISWNQGFVFADAYPTANVLLAAARRSLAIRSSVKSKEYVSFAK
jgi:hypothetical protein